MRNLLTTVLILLAAGLLALPAASQEGERSAFEGDARLNKVVTVQWQKATLFDALEELSKKTSVKLEVDRPLVDEPVMASMTSVPARQVLERVAGLLHFTWLRRGDGETARYLLVQSQQAKNEEEAELQESLRRVLQALNTELEKYRQYAKMPPDKLEEAVRKSDEELTQALAGGIANLGSSPAASRKMMDGMIARSVASPVGRTMVEVVDQLSSSQWQWLQNEQPLVFSSHPEGGDMKMPPELFNRLRAAKPEMPFPRAIFRAMGPQVEESLGKLDEMLQNRWSRANGYKITVQLTLNMGAQPIGMLRVTPEPVGGEGAEDGSAMMFMATGMNVVGAPTVFPDPNEDPEERERRLAADPVLGKKAIVKLPPLDERPKTGILAMLGTAHRAPEVLPAVEKAFGVKLLGDSYTRQAMSMVAPFGDAELPLYKVLDRIAGTTRNWERDGDTIALRSRNWAHDRRGEIPARYMRRWLAIREKQGAYTLDDLAEMVTLLRDEQVESLMFSAMEQGTMEVAEYPLVSANRGILRFYGRLIPGQRQTLLAGKPLPFRALFPYQQALLLGMNKAQSGSMFAIAFAPKKARPAALWTDARVTLSVQRTAQPAARPGAPPRPAAPGREADRETARATMEQMGMGMPVQAITFRITFPDGQKDEYPIPIFAALPRK